MVQVTKLEISDLRVIRHLSLRPNVGINFITGSNGAGKTSIFEALYLSGRGRTFRHKDAGPMIRKGARYAQVVVNIDEPGTGASSVLGVRREKANLVCRLNGEAVRRRSEMAETLPVQWIGSQPQQFLGLGPEVRRHFLDMGVFHVEQGYLAVLTQFHKILRQRNAALRERSVDVDLVTIWDTEFAACAAHISDARERLIKALMPSVSNLIKHWECGFSVDYRYRRGWQQDFDIFDQLVSKRETDLKMGFTSVGPQRAELELLANGDLAEKRLSRGQQKLLVVALNLALFDLVVRQRGATPVVVIDDLAAELDNDNKTKLIRELEYRNAQVFLSKIEKNSLPEPQGDYQTFHVEHGNLVSC